MTIAPDRLALKRFIRALKKILETFILSWKIKKPARFLSLNGLHFTIFTQIWVQK